MKKMKLFILGLGMIGLFITPSFALFDGGINYITGKNDYSGTDVYLLFGKDNWWIKPTYSSWKADNIDRVNMFGARAGFEKRLYTLGVGASVTPESNDYKSFSIGGDITFSLNPTSDSRTRLAGPNAGFVKRSGEGVTQVDLGASVNLTAHNYTKTDNDLKEIDFSVFAGAKIFITNLSANYTFYTYDDSSLAKTKGSASLRPYGMSSYMPAFPESNLNLKLDIPGTPIVTPFISYNHINFKTDDTLNVYNLGAYIDLNMVGANVNYETYKEGGERYNFLSVSGALRF
ncbi:MAG: hypothetical protein GX445_05265 [Elusimicrobia bacterium]|nr:hypothetical protein [Elusimicrobiota bacterium]